MRALTLTQPWATLIAIGAKKVETRSWRPPANVIGERIAIHAAKGLGPVGGRRGLLALCNNEPFLTALCNSNRRDGSRGTYDYEDLLDVCGFVVATAVVVSAGEASAVAESLRTSGQFSELAFGDYSRGRFAWQLAGVMRLPSPVEMRGSLSVFKVEAAVAELVEAQVAMGVGR